MEFSSAWLRQAVADAGVGARAARRRPSAGDPWSRRRCRGVVLRCRNLWKAWNPGIPLEVGEARIVCFSGCLCFFLVFKFSCNFIKAWVWDLSMILEDASWVMFINRSKIWVEFAARRWKKPGENVKRARVKKVTCWEKSVDKQLSTLVIWFCRNMFFKDRKNDKSRKNIFNINNPLREMDGLLMRSIRQDTAMTSSPQLSSMYSMRLETAACDPETAAGVFG